MPRLSRLIAFTAISSACCGCSLSYPVLTHDWKDYLGRQVAVENKAVLLASDSLYPRFQVEAGRISTLHARIADLPVGTEIAVGSLWRSTSWSPISGRVSTDYALVTLASPVIGRVKAKLTVEEFDDVFDGDKYYPQPAPKTDYDK